MKKTLVFLLTLYKKAISPLLFQLLGNGCRYSPTCSEYAIEAMEMYGVKKGAKLATKRIARCHPFSRHPQIDPVPVSTLRK